MSASQDGRCQNDRGESWKPYFAQDRIYKYINGSTLQRALEFAGMDRPCILIPELDRKPEWLIANLEHAFERMACPFYVRQMRTAGPM